MRSIQTHVDDRHIPGLGLPRTLLRVVAAACIVLSCVGLLLTVDGVVAAVRTPPPFTGYIYAVSITVVFVQQVLLIYCGQRLWRCRTHVRGLLLFIAAAPVAIVLAVIILWATATSLVYSALSAISNAIGPFAVQVVTGFPLWGPLLAYWSHNRLYGAQQERVKLGHCAHCDYDLRGGQTVCPECGLPSATPREAAIG